MSFSFPIAEFLKEGFDAYYDVCIIGGGVMGCAAAYFLAQKVYKGLKICVVEKDSSVSHDICAKLSFLEKCTFKIHTEDACGTLTSLHFTLGKERDVFVSSWIVSSPNGCVRIYFSLF